MPENVPYVWIGEAWKHSDLVARTVHANKEDAEEDIKTLSPRADAYHIERERLHLGSDYGSDTSIEALLTEDRGTEVRA